MEKTLTLNVKANVMAALAALKQLGQYFTLAFKFEKAEVEFKHLIGNIDEAKRHVEELRQMGQTGAFGFDELASASKTLINFSDGVLKGTTYLNTLADASAATGIPLDTLAKNVGKLYSKLASGDDITKTVEQLEKAGIISADLSNELITMYENGEPLADIWNKLTTSLEEFGQTNNDITNTAGGQIDKLKNEVDDIGASFAENFFGPIKEAAPEISDALKGIGAVVGTIGAGLGKIAGWVSKVIGGFVALGKVAKDLIPGMKESDWNDQLAENIMKETQADNEKKAAEEGLKKAEEKRKIAQQEKIEREEAAKRLAQMEKDTKAAKEAERERLKAVQELNRQYSKQQSLVNSIESNIKKQASILMAGYSSAISTTGRMGGYQSTTELGFANKMPGADPQLDELRKQTTILQKLEQKLPEGSTFN